jgi:hypothetical protein
LGIVPVFGGLLIIHQKGEPLIFQEEMSDQVGTLTLYHVEMFSHASLIVEIACSLSKGGAL